MKAQGRQASPTVRRMLGGTILAASWICGSFSGAAGEGEPVAIEAAGILPVSGERRVSIRAVRGEISVRPGKPAEIRFLSLSASDRRTELPLAVRIHDGEVRLEPPAEEPPAPRLVQVALPAEMHVLVEAEQGKVAASGLAGGFELRGTGLEIELRGMEGTIELSLAESDGIVENVAGDLALSATGTRARIHSVGGDCSVEARGGRIEIRQCKGAFTGDLDGAVLVAGEMGGPVELEARGGSVLLAGAAAGATLSVSGTNLEFERCRGDVTVQSDADVQFREMQASFHLDSYGGLLRGFRNDGLLEVRTRAATIALEGLSGPTRIEGDGLRISLKTVAGDTAVFATTSEVAVEGATGKLYIENERGDVRVADASGPVEIHSRLGAVRAVDLSGPVTIEADGREVEVGWKTLGGTDDSFIRNEGGDVRVLFPASGGCQVLAETNFGRIESDLPAVRLFDGGRSAQGFVGRARRPEVRIQSAGDVLLLGPAPRESASEEGS